LQIVLVVRKAQEVGNVCVVPDFSKMATVVVLNVQADILKRLFPTTPVKNALRGTLL
jgi:hypothetical protein